MYNFEAISTDMRSRSRSTLRLRRRRARDGLRHQTMTRANGASREDATTRESVTRTVANDRARVFAREPIL